MTDTLMAAAAIPDILLVAAMPETLLVAAAMSDMLLIAAAMTDMLLAAAAAAVSGPGVLRVAGGQYQQPATVPAPVPVRNARRRRLVLAPGPAPAPPGESVLRGRELTPWHPSLINTLHQLKALWRACVSVVQECAHFMHQFHAAAQSCPHPLCSSVPCGAGTCTLGESVYCVLKRYV